VFAASRGIGSSIFMVGRSEHPSSNQDRVRVRPEFKQVPHRLSTEQNPGSNGLRVRFVPGLSDARLVLTIRLEGERELVADDETNGNVDAALHAFHSHGDVVRCHVPRSGNVVPLLGNTVTFSFVPIELKIILKQRTMFLDHRSGNFITTVTRSRSPGWPATSRRRCSGGRRSLTDGGHLKRRPVEQRNASVDSDPASSRAA
jgi:hypothetical protein